MVCTTVRLRYKRDCGINPSLNQKHKAHCAKKIKDVITFNTK